MLIFLIIIRFLAFGFTLFFIIKGIADIIRTFLRGKRAGIIKVCIKPLVIIIPLIPLCVLSILIGISFSRASDMRKSTSEWEQLRGTEYSEYYTQYYNDMFLQYDGIEITDFDKFVDEQVAAYQRYTNNYTHAGVITLLFTLLMLTSVFDKIFYLTESGIFTRSLKQPEEFFVKRCEGRLDVYFKAPQSITKPLISFRSTPDNLAALGRFIEWEDETEIETENS